MAAFAMANPGYTLLIVLTIMCSIYYTIMVIMNAWQARAVEREKTKQAEIKARVKEGERAARLLEPPPLPPLPALPAETPRKNKRG